MCGITAIFAYKSDAPPVRLRELESISQAMVRRGPDGSGHWLDNEKRIGLAHRRLSIIDLTAKASQPMTRNSLNGHKDRYRITFNGEIYNFRVLREELEAKGVKFTTESDTEVLIRLYERDGPYMAEKLRGMFAFAIWDHVAQQLFLARDHFGVKPLYTADDGKTLRVASQVKALKAGMANDSSGPDAAGYVGFFLFGSIPEPYTLHTNIRALPAGSTLTVEKGGKRKKTCFFDPANVLKNSVKTGPSINTLRDIMLDSVKHHLVADVPIGLFLSSGLDSATLAGLATEVSNTKINTITLGFEEFKNTQNDEAPLAKTVAKHYKTQHYTEHISRSQFMAALPKVLSTMDQPSVDGVNTFFVARAAANAGLKVALSGIGGDELFAGYDTFTTVPKIARTLGTIPGINSFGKFFRTITGSLIRTMTSPKYASILELGNTIGGAYFIRRGLFMPWELPEFMEPDMVHDGWKALEPISRLNDTVTGIPSPENKLRILEMTMYMRNQLLRDADWAGMAHSLEIRVPLIDPILFSSLAPLLGTTNSPTKRDMANTPRPALPDTILDRPKTGFSIPLEKWLSESPRDKFNLRLWAHKVFEPYIEQT
ncbi:MAG: asparagine synthase (glutamine-hydrolyzing) [Magnetovibrio sp.]|nr:asparagine synthase (glutamine-hydrolyzing) [Magnetovibrio sp.]|tara:strand:+ start:463 stop:2259 length:1797 start_codon:yes stop_codon:yes gene_type:complete